MKYDVQGVNDDLKKKHTHTHSEEEKRNKWSLFVLFEFISKVVLDDVQIE